MAHARKIDGSNKQSEIAHGCRQRVRGPALAPSHSSGRVETLQQMLGNQGVLRRMEGGLRISDVNDPAEREADRVAQAVMTSQNGTSRPPAVATSPRPAIQRKCATCEEEEEKVHVQRKESSAAQPIAVPPIVGQVLNTPGQPLDASTRSFMESRFGHDFGSVRVHADAKAAESVRGINAVAYTVGQDIAFGASQYQTQTASGRKLLAHELTHVVQQSGRRGSANRIHEVVDDDASEREAESIAEKGPLPGALLPDPLKKTSEPMIQMQPTTPMPLTVSGDALRPSPPAGVAIKNGTLQWELSFVGNPGTTTAAGAITQGSDVRMKASFTHGGGPKACPMVTFIQTVAPSIGGMPDAAHLLFTREPTSGASLDVLEKETEPFGTAGPMPAQAGIQAEKGATLAGVAPGSVATFKDEPVRDAGAIPPGQLLARVFELAVICVETGETFGSIRWGYTKTSNGVIALVGGQAADVSSTSGSAGLEAVRQAFYGGYFQYSLPGFSPGSAVLTHAHKTTLSTVASTGNVRRILLVGANDNSGGAEAKADLSLQRANAVRDYLIKDLKVDANLIEVEGHGVEARLPNPAGTQVPENRRVDIHLDRGLAGGTSFATGSAREELRFRRQDPHLTFSELIDTLLEYQKHSHLTVAECRQMQHMMNGLRYRRGIDPSIPNVDQLYGPLVKSLMPRCESEIPKEKPSFPLPELKPPRFLEEIEKATNKPPF